MNEVVSIVEVSSGVLQITMADRAHKNTFSVDLIAGLLQAFEKISNDNNAKVVVLTGYDSYFASGGTQEGLLALHNGEGKFTDINLYSLALDCSIPVISAMQGHGIGGGFVMGLFSDIVILSRESIYTTNFMRYGFTPGMGATFIVPKKLGFSLAQEMLLGAGNYRGEELKMRGVPFTVLPRQEVLSHALDLAMTLAHKPRLSLVTLKDHMVATLREELPRTIEKEVAMHDITFHQPEVRAYIETVFGK